jgi:hypothetical protein
MEALLNAFVRFIALLERTGNALGTLAFVWATVVVLGGFSEHLGCDFWVATAIVFLEAFRYLFRFLEILTRLLSNTAAFSSRGPGAGFQDLSLSKRRCNRFRHLALNYRAINCTVIVFLAAVDRNVSLLTYDFTGNHL